MKEFEEWLKTFPSEGKFILEDYILCYKEGWKAALEWVLENGESCKRNFDLCQKIREELSND